MSQVLYQKYRPQKFSEVFGQQHIKVAIQNQIAVGKTAHAYLFCGPRAVGKTTIARILAKSVNCERRKDGESEPCGKCSSCEDIRDGRALDIMEIDAASNTGVDNVRENIIANARITASKSKYKIFIIDEVHMLSTSAFNALLKTLEEPPKNVIFILATTEIHKVPGTIISRCQRYDFKKISISEIVENLNYIVSEEGISVEEEVLKNIALQSEGCLRDAQSLLGQVLFLDDKKITAASAEIVIPRSNFSILAEFSEYLFSRDITKSIYYIDNLIQEGIDADLFIKNLIEFLRKVVLVKIGGGLEYFSIEFDVETEKKILKIAEASSINEIIFAIEVFLEAGENLKKSEIISLPLEMAVLKFADTGGQKLEIGNLKLKKQEQGFSSQESNLKIEEEGKKLEIKKFEIQEQIKIKDQESHQDKIKDGEYNVGKQTAEMQSKNVGLRIEEIQNRWPEVIEGIKKYNHSMRFTLKVSKPIEVRGNILKLAHSYEFHREKAQDMKNKQNLENILKEIFRYDLLVENVIDETLSKKFNSENSEFTEMADEYAEIGEEIISENENGKDEKERRQDDNLLQDILSEMGGEVVEESL
ncbi:MAG: DNA polymerase III subunit gamma/tau [bacterium]